MTIKEIQDQIIEDFSMFDDWMDRYAMLIEMGKECPIIDDQYRDEKHLINGCQSRVWLHAELKDGKIYYTADSDAVITKGIINLLIKVFSGQTPDKEPVRLRCLLEGQPRRGSHDTCQRNMQESG